MSSIDLSVANIEDIYELSPLQKGMLFHTLRDTGVGMYMNQAVYTMHNVDVDALKQAWQQIIDRHTILRTSFQWEDLDNPQQTVHRKVEIPVAIHDWRSLEPGEQEAILRQFVHDERQRGFDLTKPPLIQISVFRITDTKWYCVLSHHHIILDGWSGNLILREARVIYEAARRGQHVNLPPPRPFRDYIQWLSEQDLGKAEAFWRHHLKGITAPTPLPADQGVSAQRGVRVHFGVWSTHFNKSMSMQLHTLARKCQVTLNTLIQGAWAILLSRYSGESDVVFGILVSGRPPSLKDVESIVGMFLNSVPFRVTVTADHSLKDWLQELKGQQVKLQEFEYSSLMMVQNWSGIPRGAPLFNSIVARKDTAGGDTRPQGLRTGRALKSTVQQNYPLLLDIAASDEVELTITYDARRFEASAMTRMMEQLRTLLEAMVVDPDQRLGNLPLMSEEERNRVLVQWNRTQAPYPYELCLHQLFEQQVKSTPDAIAIRYLDEQLTYNDLNQRANRLAYHLRGRGVGPGSLVGLCIERSLAMPIGLLAVLKSGAAYVPLDPGFPWDRLRFMLEDAQAKVLLTQEKALEQLPQEGLQVICVDRDQDDWQQQKSEDPENLTNPEDLAYVLYTSGSTGTPKGVAIPHRVPVNRMHIEYDPFQTDEALCVKTSLSFVDSVWEMFSAWRHGLATTLIPESHVKDPSLLVDTLESSGTTRIVLVPSLLRALFESEIDLSKRLPRLKHWISSGEPLPADLCQQFAQCLPNAVLTNLYGTSEIWDATRCDSRERRRGEPIPIGRPLGNVKAYVLDEDLQPVPVGISGELYIGGEGLARGYWKHPDLTAEKFIPDPFSEEEGQRLYRTGDRVRWLPDGNLEHLGRLDQQFKLRGFRIEPGEIESVLREHENVRQTAVVVRGENQLIAYIVANGSSFDVANLRDFAASRLPEYMCPTFYVSLEKLPLTPSGKIDRRALPVPNAQDIATTSVKEMSREPETALEKTIAEVWASVLGLDMISADDNFFELGGHSLSAIRVAARLMKILGKNVPLRGIFEAPTIASLANWIESGKDEQALPELVRAVDRGREAPLTYTQQRLWFLDQLNPGIASYTIPNTMRLNGRLNIAALKAALRDVVERHEVLRTTFMARDGEPLQVINPTPAEIPIEVIDVSGLPPEEREHAAQMHVRDQGRQPWNLATGPLFRAQVVTLSPTEHVLFTALHHIIADGRSMGILGRELGILYHVHCHGQPAKLPELPLQYADFAIWERQVVKRELFHNQLSYWKKTLNGAAPLEIPTDHPRPAVHNFHGAKTQFEIPKEVAVSLRKLGKQEQATTFMCLLAGFQVLLSRYSGQEDVIVGTAIWNRSRVELERLIGLFVNTIPLRTDLSGDPTFRQVLGRVRDCCLGAFANMDLPFEEMVRQIQTDRDLSRQGSPLFQIMFIHQPGGKGNQGGIAPGIRMGQQRIDTGFSNFDILLSTNDTPDAEVQCMLSYDTELFNPATIERMKVHMQILVEKVVAEPDRPLSRISILPESERLQVLVEWNSKVFEALERRCVHEIVRDLAFKDPDKIAVTFEGKELSYGELNHCANQLAHRLLNLGVGPESLVGLCIDRGTEMIVGALGILKSGGALVPMDPTYPPERLRSIINDTQCSVVVSQQSLQDSLANYVNTIICLDNDWSDINQESGSEPTGSVQLHNLAYVIYTSGSTGMPKGVLVEHKSLTNIIRTQLREFEIGRDSRVLQMLSLSFDAAMGEVFRALTAGATLCLARKEDLLPGPGLIQILKEQKITATAMSPTALAALPSVNGDLPDLRTLTIGGEVCPPKVAAQWGKGRRLINGYGPTETTIGATCAANWDLSRKTPLGRPLANVRVFVLDRWMQPVPVGTPGELYIGGIGVARGYLNRPDLTAERFVPNPFSQELGERLYCTGDLVRWLPGGTLDFLGRIDHQVKIRGYRIELGEIEAVLSEYKDVDQCAVNVHDERGIRRLVAYVTSCSKEEPLITEIRQFLKERLPEYMVPGLYVVLPSLPMTSNGKVDRKALPAPDLGELTAKKQYVEPKTEMEKSLATIWASVLGLERVGLNDNFFELGGDSISSIQVVARATEAGIVLTAKDMFLYQTIGELAPVVGKAECATAGQQRSVTDDVPPPPVQQRNVEQVSSG